MAAETARAAGRTAGRPEPERPASQARCSGLSSQGDSPPDAASLLRAPFVGHPSQGTQTASRPFVRLNVLGVQNAAALRYHTW